MAHLVLQIYKEVKERPLSLLFYFFLEDFSSFFSFLDSESGLDEGLRGENRKRE